MQKLLECIPNFSEGRDLIKIEKIKKAISKHPEVQILDVHIDPDHHRSVITFIGPPQAVIKAAFDGIKIASKLIDLRKHHGVHPRMGGTDVCPLVPLKNLTIREAKIFAEKLAKKVSEELKIPVYLYEKSAKNSTNKNLANVRNESHHIKPDYGKTKNPKTGAIAIGVRDFLIAYNINLKSSDLKIAKKIASKIREKNGGLKGVKALGLFLKSRNLAQISMNLTKIQITGIKKVFAAAAKEAKKFKTEILESEIVGLIPAKAAKISAREIKLLSPIKHYILEKRIQ